MGVDVNLYAEANPNEEELATAEEFFAARSSIGYGAEAVLIPETQEWFANPRVTVDTMSRYYGPGYERGPWPQIYGAIRTLQAAFPEAKVFYGGDTSDDGIECTDEYLAEIWEHFLGPHGDDYRSKP